MLENDVAKELVDTNAVCVRAMLQERPLLIEMCGSHGAFLSIPEQPWPTVSLCPTALHAVDTVVSVGTQALEDAWKKRQRGLLAQPRDPSVRPVRYNPCLFGRCVCQGGSVTVALARFIAFVKTLPAEDVASGKIIITWQPYLIDEDSEVSVRDHHPDAAGGQRNEESPELAGGIPRLSLQPLHTHLSLCQLRPWRCTLLLLTKDDSSLRVTKFRPVLEGGVPSFFSIYDWMHELRPDMLWEVEVATLSSRHAPVSQVAGTAYVPSSDSLGPGARIWHGDVFEKKLKADKRKRRKKRPAHEVLGSANIRERVVGVDREHGAFESNTASTPDLNPASADTAFDEDFSSLAAVAEFDIDDSADEMAEEAAQVEAGQHSSSSSSDSSSTSSSSDVLLTVEEPPTASAEAPALPDRVEVQRHVHTGTHTWGPFRLTYRRPTPSQRPAWQATCVFHGRYAVDGRLVTRCTRSIVLQDDNPASDEAQQKLRTLYSWLLAGPAARSKAAHQALPAETLDEMSLQSALAELPDPPERPVDRDSSDGEPPARQRRRRHPA